MRHLWSFLAGVTAAPLAWMLIALGQHGSAETLTRWTNLGIYHTANLIEPAVYLAVVGILLGLLGTLRLSPLGALTAGLLLTVPYVGYFAEPFAVRDAVPAGWKLLGDPMPLLLPLENGTLFLIGALLLMATFSVQRWRRWPAATVVPPVAPPPPPMADDDEPTVPDLGSAGAARTTNDPDVEPPTLGYPWPMPPPSPRENPSPWSAPPRAAHRRDTTAD
jgi:hypothetical protein